MTTATEPTETRNWSHAVASAFSFVFYPILAEVGGNVEKQPFIVYDFYRTTLC